MTADIAKDTVIALRLMLADATSVEALLLLPLIERAATLERDIRALSIAIIETQIQRLEGTAS